MEKQENIIIDGPVAHMAAVAEDLLYGIRNYSRLTGVRYEKTEDGIKFTLKNPETNEVIGISQSIAEVLVSDAVLWDMMGTKMEYDAWESKLDLINRLGKAGENNGR